MCKVWGQPIDNETRCTHYHSRKDIIAIKFKCCKNYYPCYKCHLEDVQHETKVWKKEEFDTKAILCGACRKELSITEYMNTDACIYCSAEFNSNCQLHYPYYFEK